MISKNTYFRVNDSAVRWSSAKPEKSQAYSKVHAYQDKLVWGGVVGTF